MRRPTKYSVSPAITRIAAALALILPVAVQSTPVSPTEDSQTTTIDPLTANCTSNASTTAPPATTVCNGRIPALTDDPNTGNSVDIDLSAFEGYGSAPGGALAEDTLPTHLDTLGGYLGA